MTNISSEIKFEDKKINKYQEIGEFHEGLAKVKNWDGLVGYIDVTGKEVIPCQFDSGDNFSDGMALVSLFINGIKKCGYINKNGELVIPYIYHNDSHPFSDGYAAVRLEDNGDWFYIDKTGEKKCGNYRHAFDFCNGFAHVGYYPTNDPETRFKTGIIDKDGNLYTQIDDLQGKKRTIEDVPFNLAEIFKVVTDKKTSIYYIRIKDSKLTPITKIDISTVYDTDDYIEDGYILFGGKNPEKPNEGAYGFLDENYQIAIPATFRNARRFSDGAAIVTIDNEHIGFITKDRNCISFSTKTQYKQIRDFKNGLAAVQHVNGLWGFIDKTGKKVIPCRYTKVGDFTDELAPVTDQKGSKHYINKKGKIKLHLDLYISTLELATKSVSIEAETQEELNSKKIKTLQVAKTEILESLPEPQGIQLIQQLTATIKIPPKQRKLRKTAPPKSNY